MWSGMDLIPVSSGFVGCGEKTGAGLRETPSQEYNNRVNIFSQFWSVWPASAITKDGNGQMDILLIEQVCG